MKKLNLYNGENTEITVVTDLETVAIPGRSSATVKMEDDAQFNSGEFYVEEDGNWYAKKNGATGADLEIYNAGE